MIEKHMPDVTVVGVDTGGVSTKHRKYLFHGRDQSIKNITLKYTVILMGNYSKRSYNCCDLQFWYITASFFRILKHYVVIKFGRIEWRIVKSCLLF